MLIILKIPVVYLGAVVWWAVRAEPESQNGGDDEIGVLAPLTPCGWDEWRRRRPRRRRTRPFGPPARPPRLARANPR